MASMASLILGSNADFSAAHRPVQKKGKTNISKATSNEGFQTEPLHQEALTAILEVTIRDLQLSRDPDRG